MRPPSDGGLKKGKKNILIFYFQPSLSLTIPLLGYKHTIYPTWNITELIEYEAAAAAVKDHFNPNQDFYLKPKMK